jgi:hypothetical protein
MYRSLYSSYDAILEKDAEQRIKAVAESRSGTGCSNNNNSAQDIQKRIIMLEKKKRRLSELPALSSMIQVCATMLVFESSLSLTHCFIFL